MNVLLRNEDSMRQFVEIRSLNLKPDTREEFHRLYIEKALPLLKRCNFDVVAHGWSLHDENTYYVIRRFVTLAQREQTEDAYYASYERIMSMSWMRTLCRGYGNRLFVQADKEKRYNIRSESALP